MTRTRTSRHALLVRSCHAATLAMLFWLVQGTALAEPYRLRGDALASAESPVGLLTLEADGTLAPTWPWLTAEAVVWLGAGQSDIGRSEATGDVLVIVARARDPGGRGDARLGRFVATLGALRPLHIDGTAILYRLPWQWRVEAFAGVPVERELSADAYDWAAGGRLSRSLGAWGSAGIAYLQRRNGGWLDGEEIAGDAACAPTPWLDLAGKLAYDLIDRGVSEAHVSAAARRGPVRVELFGLHRSPSRLLPATSLFSVLGDVPAQRGGLAARWRAAPRLDIDGEVAVRRTGGSSDPDAMTDAPTSIFETSAGAAYGESLSLRALLRLDDRGKSALSLQARRERAPYRATVQPDQKTDLGAGFTGIRAAGRLAMNERLELAIEAELAFPDRTTEVRADGQVRQRGAVWPWGLVAVRWQLAPAWQLAAAIEASASPEYSYHLDALTRLSRAWEIP